MTLRFSFDELVCRTRIIDALAPIADSVLHDGKTALKCR
jgi:hypothetical protein